MKYFNSYKNDNSGRIFYHSFSETEKKGHTFNQSQKLRLIEFTDVWHFSGISIIDYERCFRGDLCRLPRPS